MEQIQSSMVNQEVVSALENSVESLRAEMKRLDGTHRQLLLRYAALKGVVDDCFKRFEHQSPIGKRIIVKSIEAWCLIIIYVHRIF